MGLRKGWQVQLHILFPPPQNLKTKSKSENKGNVDVASFSLLRPIISDAGHFLSNFPFPTSQDKVTISWGFSSLLRNSMQLVIHYETKPQP